MIQAYKEVLRLPRPVWILFWAGVINRMGNMVLPFLALYSNQVLGLSAADAGIIVTIYGVGALVAGAIGGWLCDRFGAVHILIGSLLVSAVFQVSLSFVFNPYAFAFVTFCLAVAVESFRPSLLTLASQYGPREQQRQTFALIRMSVNLGMSIGPALGGVIFVYSPVLLFWFNASTSVLAGLVVWIALARRIFVGDAEEQPDRKLSLFDSLRLAYTDRRLMWMLCAVTPGLLILFQHESALPLILTNDMHLTEADYGAIFTVNTLLIVAFEIWLTSSMARFGPKQIMAGGSLLVGLGFALIYWVKTPIHLQLMTVVWTFGEMLLFPIAISYVSEISTPRTRGSYMAAYGVAVSLNLVLAPMLGTGIWQAYGLGYYSLFCLLLGIVGAAILWSSKE
jgi:MFS family permease